MTIPPELCMAHRFSQHFGFPIGNSNDLVSQSTGLALMLFAWCHQANPPPLPECNYPLDWASYLGSQTCTHRRGCLSFKWKNICQAQSVDYSCSQSFQVLAVSVMMIDNPFSPHETNGQYNRGA